MKKIFIGVITVTMFFIGIGECFAFSAVLEFEGPTSGLIGDEISVSMYINPTDVTSGIGTIGGYLVFDDTKLEFVKSVSNPSSGLTALNNEAIFKYALVDFSGGTNAPKTRTLLITYTFRVIGGGSSEIGFRDLEIGDTSNTVIPTTIEELSTTLVAPSSDNALSSITVGTYSLNPSFSADTTEYNVTVPFLTTSVNVAATLSDSKAKMTGAGNKNLNVGNNVVILKVTAEDGSIRNYTVNITREADNRSSDNTLSSLTVNNHTLSPNFDSDILNYNLTVSNDITDLTVNALANDSKATVVVTGGNALKVGSNVVSIKVTAENTVVRTYNINVTRQDVPLNDDASLGSLGVAGYNLNPLFESGVYTYNLTIPYEVSNLEVNAVANSSLSSVSVTGASNLVVGSNSVNITVTAENGDTKKYTINVVREEKVVDSNNKLSDLSVDGFDITPKFNSDTYDYSMLIPFEVSDLTVNAFAASDKAVVSVSGNTNLQVGQNKIVVKVIAESGVVLDYTINVTKEAREVVVLDDNALLKSLIISGYDLDPVFDSLETSYILNVSNDVSSLDIEALAQSEKANVVISGNTDFKEGINSIRITVTAEDNSIKTYVINVNRREVIEVEKPTLSNDNYLTSLEIDGYELEFDKNLNSYNLLVPFEVSSLRLDYTKSSSKSSVMISGNESFIINEVNTVEISVTAEDGSLRVYTLNVTRSPLSSDNKLEKLLVDNVLISGFNSNVTNYDLIVESDVDVIDLNAFAFNDKAIITGIGSHELVDGNNTFLISVEDENSFIRYYQVNIYKEVTESSLWLILVLIGLGFSLLALIVIVVVLIKRKPVTEIARTNDKTLIDFKPEFNFNSHNGSENSLEYGATKKLIESNDVKEVPFDPYDDIVTKEEIIDAINHKDAETLKMLYEQEMLNRKKDEMKKRRDDEWDL